MRIRTKALLAAGFGMFIAGTVLGVFSLVTLRLHRADAMKAALYEIVRGAFELNAITDDYLRTFSPRASDQWRSRHHRLGRQIADVRPRVRDEAAMAADLAQIHSEVAVLFDNLSEAQRLMARSADPRVATELRQRLAAQLSTKLMATVTTATQLNDAVRRRVRRTRRVLDAVVLASLLALCVALVASSLLLIRTVVLPLRRFRREVAVIGGGDLNHRVSLSVDNEIGELAAAFNAMRENLLRVTTSRDELEREVQARQEAEERLTQTLRRLEDSNTELEQFAYVASHDLQEPLRKICAFGDRLQSKYRDRFDDKGRDYLDRMLSASRRMQNLINDLLLYSRLTTRARPFEPVDLGAVVRDVVSDLEPRLQETHGHVIADPLPTVDAEATQMHQLFQNLIGNGLKYHREGVPPVVRIAERPPGETDNENAVTLVVEDNGIGFDDRYKERIFKIFQRLHGRMEYEGTGIGLAICRKIVDRHDGRIDVHSEPGKGTAFTLVLPRRHAENHTEGADDE